MAQRLTTEEFVRNATVVHGDKYDYSLVEYVNTSTPVKIICQEHGVFNQRPGGHVNQKQGCPKCAGLGLSTDERFWKFVDKEGDVHPQMESRCWKWRGAKNQDGYGMIGRRGGKLIYAHVLSWMIHFGGIPYENNYLGRLHVLHRCNNPECTRPNHLFLGTHTDNMQDMARKGRSTFGDKHRDAKLTWEKVEKMRLMWETGKWNQRELAEIFGIEKSGVSRIVRGENWRKRHGE